ncbi:hypothetical protein DIE07_03565 [Burkholderia sp. Bp9002]|nr:hypothetical protein DIE07_03565 [Burkholderia sp. Bp9002]
MQPWMLECFGAAIATDRMERNHRFLEEALELVQACGCTAKVERIRARHAAKPKYAPLPSAL